MQDIKCETRDNLLESALRMEVAARCQRAYFHDLSNSLQPVFAGVEVLIRAATVGTVSPVAQVADFAKLAVSQHREAVEGLLRSVIGVETPSTQVDMNELLQKITSFLTHDAYQHGVKVSLRLCEEARVQARLSTLRLIFLGLLTDAIDAVPSHGAIHVATSVNDASVTIDLQDSRIRSERDPTALIDIDNVEGPLRMALLLPVVRRLVTKEGGSIEHVGPAPGHALRITLPRAA